MVDIPGYWLPRPPMTIPAGVRDQFDESLGEALAAGPDRPLDYRLDAPKWQFLCHVAERADYVFHGSGNPGITEFEPRQPRDFTEFGGRRAVFASTDGVWPMFYAILDRERVPMSLCNGCVRFGEEPRYYFSISAPALERQPWRTGMVYLLPSATFELEPPTGRMRPAQAASAAPVRPVAKLAVGPEDFPFLHLIRGHDDQRLAARAAADPTGFPWG